MKEHGKKVSGKQRSHTMSRDAWIKLGDICGVLMVLLIVATLLRALQGLVNFLLALFHYSGGSIGYLEFVAWCIFSWCFSEMLNRITQIKD